MKTGSAAVLAAVFALSISTACKQREGTSSEAKQADSEIVEGTIGNVQCFEANFGLEKNHCILDVDLVGGESIRLLSNDVYDLSPEIRASLQGRALAVFNDLVLPVEEEKIAHDLTENFGAGNFMYFFGDLPWLCFNKMLEKEKCGWSFPSDFVASAENLQNSKTTVKATLQAKYVANEHPELREEEAIAVHSYTVSLYYDVNNALRSTKEEEITPWADAIATIASGLRKLSRFEGTVYRGVDLSEYKTDRYVDAFNLMEPIQELAFTSTSAEKGDAFSKPIRFVIRSHTGAQISALSQFPSEKEVLFAPGTWFRVTGINDGEDSLEIEMTELVVIR
jgi:hypothetical protein